MTGWILAGFLAALAALAAAVIARRGRRATPPAATYICPHCNEKDCHCHRDTPA